MHDSFKRTCAQPINFPSVGKRHQLCHAAEALKKRFEKNQLSLLDSLEAERSGNRDRLLQKLAAKKKQLMATADGTKQIKDLEIAVFAEIEVMNKNYDDQETYAVGRAQEECMYALSAICKF